MYTLKYIGPEPDCCAQWQYKDAKGVFLHVAEHIAEDLEDGEADFDDSDVQDIVEALKGSSFKRLIKSANARLYPTNGDYYEAYLDDPEIRDVSQSHEERMTKVFESVERARKAWQEWKSEPA